MTAQTHFLTPAEQAQLERKHNARVVAVMRQAYPGLDTDATRDLLRHGSKSAVVQDWNRIPENSRNERANGARLVLVNGVRGGAALTTWRGPKAWAEAENVEPRTKQAWLTCGLHVRRSATPTVVRQTPGGRAVWLYALGATEPAHV